MRRSYWFTATVHGWMFIKLTQVKRGHSFTVAVLLDFAHKFMRLPYELCTEPGRHPVFLEEVESGPASATSDDELAQLRARLGHVLDQIRDFFVERHEMNLRFQ